MLNHIGPLRKNKNTALDENPSFAITSLDVNRYKRHFTSLLERVCRMAANVGQSGTTETDDDTIEEKHEIEEEQEPPTSEWLNSTISSTGII